MFKVNNKDTRRTPIGIFIVNFEHISDFVLVFLLLTLDKQMLAGSNDFGDFSQIAKFRQC